MNEWLTAYCVIGLAGWFWPRLGFFLLFVTMLFASTPK